MVCSLLLMAAFAVEVLHSALWGMEWLYVLGILMMGCSLLAALMPDGVLGKMQVMDGWSILIERGKGGAEEVFSDAENFLEEGKAPNVKIGRGEMAHGLTRGIL